MTTRSTPGAGSSRTATSPTASTISPSGLPPIGYGHPRKSRQASSSSSYFPSVDHSRRPSSISHRQSSQTSLSGTSTPLASYPRRKRKEGALYNVPEGETDWSGLEPDEVLKRLPVGEVKRVEAKMRGEALNKQSELRSMVGTRYRDLLTSATQITALRGSSLKLSKSLQSAVQSCTSPKEVAVTAAPSEKSDGEEVLNLLPIAAHMKLLLDAPEVLYSLLAHHSFLKAAFLWLVARVAKESLMGMPEDVNSSYIPLLQKQWETLTPFRAQIVQRATAALRSRQPIDTRTLAETLLAIILLDNLSVPDALALFLSQRIKTLRDILHPESTRGSRNRRDSRASIRSMSKERDEIESVLAESVKSLLDTVILVRAVFAKRNLGGSLLEELQRMVQVGETLPSPIKEFNPRRTSHERRASRLASISIQVAPIAPSPSGPPVSAPQVLQSLPSSQVLLHHLPSTITSFTPFIAPSFPPDIEDKLTAWQSTTIGILRDAGPEWLATLHSVADVWHVRAKLASLLDEGSLQEDIKQALEEQWGKRIESIWQDKLDRFVVLAESKTRQAGETLKVKGSEADTILSSFIFSEMPFPPAPTYALTASATPFNNFLSTIQKRGALRTPLLDEILVTLETAAKDLKQDISGLPSNLYTSYGTKVQDTLRRLVTSLSTVLEDVAIEGEDNKSGIEAEILVGRVALYLARQSDCLADLTAEAGSDLAAVRVELVGLHAKSVERWTHKTVNEAVVLLAPIFDPLFGPSEVAASWQGPQPVAPSTPIMVALHALVKASRRLGVPPGDDLPVVKDLVLRFVETACELEGWKSAEAESAAQAAFDLSFLGLLVETKAESDTSIRKLLAKIPSSMPDDFAAQLPSLVEDSLRRSQLLLYPILRHLRSAAVPATGADLRNGLLRFGAPKGSSGIGTEFRSPLAVAKPGKRFGLLSITA